MLFNSLQYALFLPVTLALYYLARGRWRLIVLLLASYFFYASWNWTYLFLIFGLTIINYVIGWGIFKLPDQERATLRSWLLALGIVINLGTLAFYKYTAFILTNIVALFSIFDQHLTVPVFDPVLPLAISFFCFEYIHYLVDVWKGHPAIRSPLKFAIFSSFFPTQIAGPIKRYENFVPQLDNPPSFAWERLGPGLKLIVTGFFKKVVLADNLAHWVNTGFGAVAPGKPALPTEEAWLVVLAFAMQIYFDFSGYTDMGRGSALLLGFQVPENFRRPYLSTSIREFWRRWHISLSSWLRDYVYIPLGGNKHGRDRNLFITLVLGGLWHGANWTFVIWGAFQGVLLVLNRRLSPLYPALPGFWRPARAIAGCLLTFFCVCIGWVFFRANSSDQAFHLLGMLFYGQPGAASSLVPLEKWFIVGIVLGYFGVALTRENRSWITIRLTSLFGPRSNWLKIAYQGLSPAAYTCLFAAILVLRPFESVRFIYFQF